VRIGFDWAEVWPVGGSTVEPYRTAGSSRYLGDGLPPVSSEAARRLSGLAMSELVRYTVAWLTEVGVTHVALHALVVFVLVTAFWAQPLSIPVWPCSAQTVSVSRRQRSVTLAAPWCGDDHGGPRSILTKDLTDWRVRRALDEPSWLNRFAFPGRERGIRVRPLQRSPWSVLPRNRAMPLTYFVEAMTRCPVR
jgi:hypothetical protein